MYLKVEKGLGTQMQAEVAVLRYVGNYVTAMSIPRHVSYRKTVSCRVPVSALAFHRSSACVRATSVCVCIRKKN